MCVILHDHSSTRHYVKEPRCDIACYSSLAPPVPVMPVTGWEGKQKVLHMNLPYHKGY